MELVRSISLFAALLTTGLMAGLILNPIFFLIFVGSLPLGLLAVGSRLTEGDRPGSADQLSSSSTAFSRVRCLAAGEV